MDFSSIIRAINRPLYFPTTFLNPNCFPATPHPDSKMAEKKFELYEYKPSKVAALIFVGLFLITTFIHVFQAYKKKALFLIPLIIGGFCKCLLFLIFYRRSTLLADHPHTYVVLSPLPPPISIPLPTTKLTQKPSRMDRLHLPHHLQQQPHLPRPLHNANPPPPPRPRPIRRIRVHGPRPPHNLHTRRVPLSNPHKLVNENFRLRRCAFFLDSEWRRESDG